MCYATDTNGIPMCGPCMCITCTSHAPCKHFTWVSHGYHMVITCTLKSMGYSTGWHYWAFHPGLFVGHCVHFENVFSLPCIVRLYFVSRYFCWYFHVQTVVWVSIFLYYVFGRVGLKCDHGSHDWHTACIVSTIKGPKQNREKLFWLDYFAGPPRRDGLILDKLYVM